MKLPRHQLSGRNVAELQAARGAVISPEEAAAVQQAKYGAITQGLASVGDALAGMANIQAEEELTDATMQWQSALNEYHRAIENAPPELDENGNITYDLKAEIAQEREGRQKITGDIRETIKSGTARSEFDKYVSAHGLAMDQRLASAAIEKNKDAMKAQADYQVRQYILAGDFDLARQRGIQGIANGVYTQAEWNTKRIEIDRARSTHRINSALVSDSTTVGELQALQEELSAETATSDLQLTSDEVYAYEARVNAKINGADSEAMTAKEMEYENQYLELLGPVTRGEITQADLIPLRYTLGQQRFDKLIAFAGAVAGEGIDSDPIQLQDLQGQVIAFRQGRIIDQELGYQKTAEEMADSIQMANLSFDDKDRLITELDGYMKAVRDNPDAELVLDLEVQKITGRSRDQLLVSIEGVDKSHLNEAKRLELQFKRALMREGPDFDPDQWMRDNVSEYHMRVQTQILQEHGMTEAPKTPDGNVDRAAMIEQMFNYKIQFNLSDDPDSEANIRRKVEADYNQWARLLEAG